MTVFGGPRNPMCVEENPTDSDCLILHVRNNNSLVHAVFYHS